MTVGELAERLRELDPNMPVVLLDEGQGVEWGLNSVEVYRWRDGSEQLELA
jgi:hypothetical protein